MKNIFPFILLLSIIALDANTSQKTCATKKVILPTLNKTAEYERTEAAKSIKVAAMDTALAVKETAKAKIQTVKSKMAEKKAETSRSQAACQVKNAAADTAEVIKRKAIAKTEVIKKTVHSTVDRAKEAYHHARAEHNKKAAQRHAKAAIEDTALAFKEEAKATHLSQS